MKDGATTPGDNVINSHVPNGNMFRRFRRGRRFRARPRFRTKPNIVRNHFQNDITGVVTGTETLNTVATGVDDASNRSTHVPDGSTITSIHITGECTSIPATATKFQHILFYRPGGTTISATPITDWFVTTDPLPNAAILIRRHKLYGPVTDSKASSDFTRHRFRLRWRGRILVHDGDDFIWSVLQDSGGNLAFNARVSISYRA